ncbi:MAG: hypothetical protein ACW97X_06815, partial [Candidatus Hodarchaeales archaeon]
MELGVLIFIFLLILIGILVARYTELAPQIIFWSMSRETKNNALNYITPEDLGSVAELVEFYDKKRPIIAWFFPNESETSPSVFMVPNWYYNEDHENNLKTAAILQKSGYSVLLPVFHWSLDGKVFQKRYVSPKVCQRIINHSFRYFINRPETDRRNIAIHSNGAGTILASQLVKVYPIKAIVLENGPVTLWNEFSNYLHHVKSFPFSITKTVLFCLLWPLIWRTKWQSRNSVKKLRACPSFLIATREDPRKHYWQTYSYLYRPKQFWYEHGLHFRGGIRDLWTLEYSKQIRLFFDTHFKLITTIPEFHYEMKTKRKRNGKHTFEIRITAMPPILEPIPMQIIVSHKGNNLSEYRIWFSGASLNFDYSSKLKPINVAVTPFYNVIRCTDETAGSRLWLKKDANDALPKAIDEMIKYPLRHLREDIERYFFLKSIILFETENQKAARE